MILPGIAVFFIMLLVVGSLAWLVAGAQTQVIVISNSSPTPEPTEIINASPTVEPVDNGSPASTVLPSYDDYLNWRDHYENKTTTGNPTTTPLLKILLSPAISSGDLRTNIVYHQSCHHLQVCRFYFLLGYN
jgi:hypothetical protein